MWPRIADRPLPLTDNLSSPRGSQHSGGQHSGGQHGGGQHGGGQHGRRQRGDRKPLRRALPIGAAITAAVFGTAALADVFGRPVLTLIAAGIVVCILPGLAAMLTTKTGPLALYSCAGGAVAAGWLAFAATTTVWSALPVAALVVPAVALISWYPAVARAQERAAEQARLARIGEAAERQQQKWPELLARIGYQGVVFASQEDSLAGYLVHLRLPGSGRITYQSLAGAAERLEIAARLRHGSLRFERGQHAHEVILHVTERDVLAKTVSLPAETEPLSITQPIPIGVYSDGRVCSVTLREVATLIVGLRGSGKSNLLNVLLAQLARCPDVLIFAIDLKGGRMAVPWIQPWLASQARWPVIDWLATDREEAEKMLRALLRAVDSRARSCSGGEKITPSPREPAILLICDEVAVILGIGTGGPRLTEGGVTNATLAGLATRLVMTGRSEAIDLIMATQRGTVTMTGSADLKSQCSLRIGLGVGSEADARLIIPDNVRIAADLAGLQHPGSGIVQQGRTGRVLPVKFYRLEHEEIAPIAERFGWLRPEPDPLVAEALGDDYRTRWARYHARIRAAGSDRPILPTAVIPPAIAAPPPRELPPGPSAPPEPFKDADHPARLRTIAVLKSAGVRGLTVRSIADLLAADGQDIAHQTIHRWLAEESKEGRAESAPYGRWKWRQQT